MSCHTFHHSDGRCLVAYTAYPSHTQANTVTHTHIVYEQSTNMARRTDDKAHRQVACIECSIKGSLHLRTYVQCVTIHITLRFHF